MSVLASCWGVTSWCQTTYSGWGRLRLRKGARLAEADLAASFGELVSNLESILLPTEVDLARSLAVLVKPLVAGPVVLFMAGHLGEVKVNKISSPTYPTYS